MRRILHFLLSYVCAILCGVAAFAAIEAIGEAAHQIGNRGVGLLEVLDVDLLYLLPPVHELILVGLALFIIPTALIWGGLVALNKEDGALTRLVLPLACLVVVVGFALFDRSVRLQDLISQDMIYIAVAAILGGFAFSWCMALLKKPTQRLHAQ